MTTREEDYESEISKEIKKRIEKIDQIASDLDRRCILLMMFFSVRYPKDPKKTYGFNELYRKISKIIEETKIRASFTRQSLTTHLRHLLEKELIEVDEDKESKLKIKPRRYKLSKFYVKLTEDLRPLDIPYPKDLAKRFRFRETEPLTVVLLSMYIELCFEILRKTLTYPETYGPISREYIFSYIENLTKAYRAVVFERNESENALQIFEEFREFVNQKLDDKYDKILKGVFNGQD